MNDHLKTAIFPKLDDVDQQVPKFPKLNDVVSSRPAAIVKMIL